jgi:translation initiation factor 2 alpha subunit (eIF-2alpha)
MTIEEFDEKMAAISDTELCENVQKAISDLCKTGGKSLRMSVPPSKNDTDMLLCELLNRYKKIIELSELQLVNTINEMCTESLSPDMYEMWEKVKYELFQNRKFLKESHHNQ